MGPLSQLADPAADVLSLAWIVPSARSCQRRDLALACGSMAGAFINPGFRYT